MAEGEPTAFVLGGGGMLGSAEVGMLRALVEAGIHPDLIIGSSVGALNGVLFAADPTDRGVTRLTDVWAGLTDRGVFAGSLLGQLTTLARHGTYLHSNHELESLICEAMAPRQRFEDLDVRFECIASSIERAAPQWFGSGPLVPAVLASCAVPGLLPAVEIDGVHYFDGGLIRSVPIGRAVELGARRIFVLHVGRLEEPLAVPSKPWQVATVVFEIARRHHFEEEMASLPDGIDVHVLPTGSLTPRISVRYRSTSQVTSRIEAAHRASGDYLSSIRA